MAIAEHGTIDDLVTDAANAGHQITVRLVRDWTQIGLLDQPRKRPAGRGRGSSQALYPPNQRELLLTLLSKRPGNGIGSLARIPVGIWMYWGDEYVPLRQARRAMQTWLGNPRVSLRRARETAKTIAGHLDNPAATPAARQELRKVLTEISYTGRLDEDRLERAAFDVFEPQVSQIRRALGHPAAPLMVDSFTATIKARATAAAHLNENRVADDLFYQARHTHLIGYAEYAARQPVFASSTPPQSPGMYEPVTAQTALNDCCTHLLTAIGLQIMYPERAAQLRAGRGVVQHVSPATRQAILRRIV